MPRPPPRPHSPRNLPPSPHPSDALPGNAPLVEAPKLDPTNTFQGVSQLLQTLAKNQEVLMMHLSLLKPANRPESTPMIGIQSSSSQQIPDFKEKLPVLAQRPWSCFALDF